MGKNIISKEEVKKIAELSELEVSGEEEKFSELLSDTISYVEILNELDTSNTSETYQVTGLTNIFQKGSENTVTLTQEEALENADMEEKGLFVTDPVFDR
ncbi:MAG: Asp-tRNA(Asn)/Glu-tRNA(Gln) amidotransferase subunit GatC [Patescibacteria group bacterium]|nr:aspartyl/glutamyl-tRNA amidotransferase subunit C [Patescibacteria group bacterium]